MPLFTLIQIEGDYPFGVQSSLPYIVCICTVLLARNSARYMKSIGMYREQLLKQIAQVLTLFSQTHLTFFSNY